MSCLKVRNFHENYSIITFHQKVSGINYYVSEHLIEAMLKKTKQVPMSYKALRISPQNSF